jgi:hypothetical protein
MQKKQFKYISILCILLSMSQTYAADWAILDGDGRASNLVELDMASIQQVETIAKAWVRITYPKAIEVTQNSSDKYKSVLHRIIIDCTNTRYVFSNSILYSGARGHSAILGSTRLNEREAVYQMRDVAPDTVAGLVIHYACAPVPAR